MCISTPTHAPQRRWGMWERPEKEEKASLIKDDAWSGHQRSPSFPPLIQH